VAPHKPIIDPRKQKPGAGAGLFCVALLNGLIRRSGGSFGLLSCGVEFDRLRHEIVAHGFEPGRKFASGPRQPLAAVGSLDQKFLSRLHHIYPAKFDSPIYVSLAYIFKVVGKVQSCCALATMPTIYKICAATLWRKSQRHGTFRGSEADLRDGFIHFSTAAQVAETAAKHFAGMADLLLMHVDAECLGPALKWEPSRGGALFPHLYGDLALAAVLRVEPLPLADGRHVFPLLGD
jgi:uncharacterized protein (DUF952 family)